jgi:hypothetical protein
MTTKRTRGIHHTGLLLVPAAERPASRINTKDYKVHLKPYVISIKYPLHVLLTTLLLILSKDSDST